MKRKLEKPILAEGEITGHAHVLGGDVDVFEENGIREFTLKEPTNLVHEEHKVITLPVKEFEADKVNEYDHFNEEAKKVQD